MLNLQRAEINDIFAYDYPTAIPKSEDQKIQAALIVDELRAQTMNKLYGHQNPDETLD